MKKRLFVAVLMLITPAFLWAAMSDSKAATEAFKIWGSRSWKGTGQSFVQTSADKMIGFLSPGCQQDITIVGKGSNTWDAAFASLPADKGVGGTFSGTTLLTIQSPLNAIGPPEGIVSSVQVMLDNVPLGTPLLTGNTDTIASWGVTFTWDTTQVPDGNHVMCVRQIHPDGSYAKSRATMMIVKQAL